MLRVAGAVALAIPLLIAALNGLVTDPIQFFVMGIAPLAVTLPLGWAGRRLELTDPRLVWAAAITGAALALALSALMPVSVDGEVYYFQARLIASGRLGAGPFALPEFFHYYFLVPTTDGMLYGAFPPGWPSVLALGAGLKIAWIINPLLTGLLVWLTARLTRQAFPDEPGAALLAAWLMALSPFATALGGSFMSHTLSACLTAGALILALRPTTLRSCLLGGLLLGFLFAVRPLNGLVVAGCVVAILASRRPPVAPLVAGVLVAAVCASGYLWTNSRVSGQATRPGQDTYFERTEFNATCHRLGFGHDVGCAQAHNLEGTGYHLADAPGVTFARLQELGTTGLGPGLALLLPLVLAWRRRSSPIWPLALVFLATVSTYALFYFHGNFLGARLYFEAFVPLCVLIAVGATRAGWWGIALAVSGLLGGHVALQVDAESYRWMPYAQVEQLVAAADGDKKLIFVDNAALRGRARWTHYSLGMVLGDVPGPDAAVVYAHDLGPGANLTLAQSWPDHTPYRLSLTAVGEGPNPFQAQLEPALEPMPIRAVKGGVVRMVGRFPLAERPACAFAEPAELSPGRHALRIRTNGPCTVALGSTPPGEGPFHVTLQAASSPASGVFVFKIGGRELGHVDLRGAAGANKRVPLGLSGPGVIELTGEGQADLIELRFVVP